MKILITGNPNYGLASSLHKLYPSSTFISRSSGYDLCKEEDITNLCSISLDYDIFINNSALYHFYQTWVFDKVWKYWHNNKKQGHIINIGSTTDRTSKGSDWIYSIEKKSLRDISNDRSLLSVWGKSNIRVSYISFGSLNTNKVIDKHPERILMSVDSAANYINWVINSPTNVNINEISVDIIQ